MPATLTQLPPAIWFIAGVVVIGVSLLVFWLRRNFKTTEVTLKPGPVEVKLERKDATPTAKGPESGPGLGIFIFGLCGAVVFAINCAKGSLLALAETTEAYGLPGETR